MDKKQGRLIVIEGIDGAGKTTQIELLKRYLASKGPLRPRGAMPEARSEASVPLQIISFPRYEDNLYGKLIKRYLEGEFGSINEVNPYLMALAYAGDRALVGSQIKKWVSEGKLVIANRYVSSSKAHLGANLPEEKREEFFNWLNELEYNIHGMPKADLTILLSVDPKIGQKNVFGRKPDIHEKDLKHLEEAGKIYLDLAKKETNWYVVDCMKDGKMRTKEEIHKEILRLVASG